MPQKTRDPEPTTVAAPAKPAAEGILHELAAAAVAVLKAGSPKDYTDAAKALRAVLAKVPKP